MAKALALITAAELEELTELFRARTDAVGRQQKRRAIMKLWWKIRHHMWHNQHPKKSLREAMKEMSRE